MRSSNHQYLGGSSEGDEKVIEGGKGSEGGKGNKGKEPGERREIKEEAGYTNLKKVHSGRWVFNSYKSLEQ